MYLKLFGDNDTSGNLSSQSQISDGRHFWCSRRSDVKNRYQLSLYIGDTIGEQRRISHATQQPFYFIWVHACTCFNSRIRCKIKAISHVIFVQMHRHLSNSIILSHCLPRQQQYSLSPPSRPTGFIKISLIESWLVSNDCKHEAGDRPGLLNEDKVTRLHREYRLLYDK